MAAMTDKSSMDNAEEIISRFGGIRPMAHKMDVPVTTVQGWKKRNAIPGNRRKQVIEAAKTNNVDLSDLIAGAANENAVSDTVDVTIENVRPKDSITATRRAAAAIEPVSTNEAMLAQIKEAQSMTFIKNVWFTSIVITIVVVGSAVLLWPTKQQIAHNRDSIATLQGGVSGVKKQLGFLKGLIPSDIEAQFAQIKDQTRSIQEKVTMLSEKAEVVATDVLDPNASIATRIDRIEGHVTALVGPSKLTAMLQKVQGMSQSLEGQTQLSSSIADLNALFKGVQGGGGNLDEALQQAQQEDDALGQTLQGVAPQDLKAAALLLGMSQFRSSLHRSAPFEEDLALMQKMLGDNDPELQAAIAKLAPKSASGALTPDGLKGEFKGLAGDIVVASLKGEDVSVQERAKARFNDFMQVEKDGELITGTDTQAKTLRAQRLLDEGDIAGAIAELQTLEGEASAAAQPFINEAQMTMMAQQLQGMFSSRVMSRVGGANLGVTTMGADLMQEIKKLAPRRVLKDEASGIIILEPKAKFLP